MTKCSSCGQGINSTYVREGSKGLMRKVGFYCVYCDIYYDPKSEKLYTVNTKTVYSDIAIESEEQPLTEYLRAKQASLGRDLDPGPLPYQGLIR
jgi:hypothetical protein